MNAFESESTHPTLREVFIILLLSVVLAGLVTFALSEFLTKVSLILGELCIIIPALVFLRTKKYNIIQVFRLHLVNKNILLASMILGISITVLIDELDRIINIFFKLPPELEEVLVQAMQAQTLSDWLILIIAVVLLAGMLEEMLFRGLLLQALERRFELPHAIFLSALIFALFHFPLWLIQVIFLGIILGFLAWRSNSIIPGIILHCFNNAFAIVFLNIGEQNLNWYNWHNHVNPPVLVIAAAMAYYGMKWFLKLTYEEI